MNVTIVSFKTNVKFKQKFLILIPSQNIDRANRLNA